MNKEEKLKITKDKLLEASAMLMENNDDPMKVTSREIAKAAGVQPAMINYCFGSREELIESIIKSELALLYKLQDSDCSKSLGT